MNKLKLYNKQREEFFKTIKPFRIRYDIHILHCDQE